MTGVRLPKASSGAKWGFQKFRIRKSIDFPMASVAVVLNLEGDKVVRARIALGAVAPTPLRARKAEAVLEGSAPTPEAAGPPQGRSWPEPCRSRKTNIRSISSRPWWNAQFWLRQGG